MNKKLNIKRVIFDSLLLFLSVFSFSIKNTEIQQIDQCISIKQKVFQEEKKIIEKLDKFFHQTFAIVREHKLFILEKIIAQSFLVLFAATFHKDLFRIQW